MPPVTVGPRGETVDSEVLDRLDFATAERVVREGLTALPPDLGGVGVPPTLLERPPGAPAPGGRTPDIDTRAIATGTGAVVGGAGGALLGGPSVAGVPATAVAGAGAGAGTAGLLYDLATGQVRPPAEQAVRGVADVATGVLGEVIGRGVAEPIARGIARHVVSPITRRVLPRVLDAEAVQGTMARIAGAPDPRVRAAEAEARQARTALRDLVAQARTAAQAERAATTATRAERAASAEFAGAMGAAESLAANLAQARAALAAARREAETLLRSVGAGPTPQDPVGRLGAGVEAGRQLQSAYQRFRQQSERAFEALNQAFGDDPVIQPSRLRTVAERLATEAEGSPAGVPAFVRRLLGDRPDLSTVGGVTLNPADPQSHALMAAIRKALGEATETGLSWREAQLIKAHLGELARSPNLVGSVRQGQARALLRALDADLDAFLATPSQGPMKATYDAAKQEYRIGRTLLNSTLARAIRAKPAQVAETVFSATDPERVLDLKALLAPLGAEGDRLYETLATGWLAQRFERALVQGGKAFSPTAFVKELEPYLQTGTLDLILPPESAQAVRRLVGQWIDLAGAERLVRTGPGQLASLQAKTREAGVRLSETAGTAMRAREAAHAARTTAPTAADVEAARHRLATATETARAAREQESRLLHTRDVERLVRFALSPSVAAGVGAGALGAPGAVLGAGGALATRAALRRASESEAVRRALTGEFSGTVPAGALRWAAQIVAQGTLNPAEPPRRP